MAGPATYLSNTVQARPVITPVPDRLAGKTAIVTGSGRGIGKAIATRLAQEGAAVAIVDKDLPAAGGVASSLGEMGLKARAIEADVTSQSAVNDLIREAVREFGGLDILVNNAGIILFGSLLDCPIGDFERTIKVDLTGALRCTQAAAKQMVRQGRGGRLIHIGSTASLFPAPQQGAYSVAKAGLRMLSRTMAMELVEHGITSNLVCPHGAITDMNRELLEDPEVMSQLESRIPAKRLAKVEEIAALVAFLASGESTYITGAELVHDGGVTVSGLWWR